MTAPLDTRPPGGSPARLLAGRYELGELLGSGGAAEVFRGTDRRLGRPVAVKVFRPGAGGGMEDRSEDEALLLARLEHAGLVTLYDIGRHEGRSFLVMQLVEGRTLHQSAAGIAMDPHRVAELGADLAGTLAHVHAADVMHCDVKPSNILLDAEGRPYLTDFGISRPVDATAPTSGGALVGTAAYLAPEQVRGERVGRPADVYALGLVLLECLKGQLEYGGRPLESAIARLHRPPVIPDGLPRELDALLGEMTSPEPGARPDARSCADRLEYVLDTTRPGRFLPPAGKFTHEGSAMASLGGDASPAVGGSGDTRHDPLSVPASGIRWRAGMLAAGAAAAITVLGVTLSGAEPAGGSGAATVLDPEPSRSADESAPSSPADSPAVSKGDGSGAAPARRPANHGPHPAAAKGDGTPGKPDRTGKAADAGPGRTAGTGTDRQSGQTAKRADAEDKGGGRRGQV